MAIQADATGMARRAARAAAARPWRRVIRGMTKCSKGLRGRSVRACVVAAIASALAPEVEAAVFDVEGRVSVAAVDTLVFAEPSVAGPAVVTHHGLMSEWGVLVVRLEGLDGVQREQQCGRGGRRWECGELAARWLGQRLEDRMVRCRVTGGRREALFRGFRGGRSRGARVGLERPLQRRRG